MYGNKRQNCSRSDCVLSSLSKELCIFIKAVMGSEPCMDKIQIKDGGEKEGWMKDSEGENEKGGVPLKIAGTNHILYKICKGNGPHIRT